MALKPKGVVPPHAPYSPPKISSDLVYAVKALFAGKANEHQQGLFTQWLIAEACKKDDMPWFPGGLEGDRDTSFANGRRFVALQVVKALNMPAELVAQMREEESAQRGPVTEGEEIGRHD